MRKAYNITGFNQLKLTNSEEIEAKTIEYFNSMKEQERPYTIPGYANALGITRLTLEKYVNMRGKDLPEVNVLEEQVREVEYAIDNGMQRLSFCNIRPTKLYLEELREVLELRKVINVLIYGYSKIEEYNTERLYDTQGNRGSIFILKNSYGYDDKQELEINVTKKLEDFIKEELED